MLARRLLLGAAWIAVALGFAAFLAGHVDLCGRSPAPEPRQEDPPVGYLGGDACRSCHGRVAETFAASGMDCSSDALGAGSVVAGLSGRGDLRFPSQELVGGRPTARGIDCERCHGPGEAHVDFRRNAPEEIPDRDETIVNPGKLIPGPRMHVCLECHLGDTGSTGRLRGPRRHLSDLPPGGGSGSSTQAVAAPPVEKEGPGPGSQGDRLMRSRCFQVSGGAIDCLTCHDPHRSVRAGGRAPDHFRRACLTCHAAGSCALPERERRALSAVDDCAVCHMRREGTSDHHPDGSADHWIRRRIEDRKPAHAGRSVRQPGRINPV